jgi:dienelactone hydrolase
MGVLVSDPEQTARLARAGLDVLLAQDAADAGPREAGVADWRLELYGGIKHSFTSPAADQLTIPGFGYDKQADRRSWRSMLGLFSDVLGPASGRGPSG